MQPLTCVAHRLAVPALLAGCVLITGCAATGTTSPPTVHDSLPEPAVLVRTIAPEPEPGLIPVARYGRYTLVEMVPEPAQRDLLRQVIEISIPPTLDASVGDALRHVLLRTGYRLCDAPDAASLFTLPLPARTCGSGHCRCAMPCWRWPVRPGICQSMTRRARCASRA